MMFTPAQARETMPCPIVRTFDKKAGPNCMADQCPLWRWQPLMANDPRFKAAISKVMSAKIDGGLGLSHNKAVAHVTANRLELGLPEHPEKGWCGLGGEPKA